MILSSSNFIVSNTCFYQNKFLGTSGMQHNVKFDHNLIRNVIFTCAVEWFTIWTTFKLFPLIFFQLFHIFLKNNFLLRFSFLAIFRRWRRKYLKNEKSAKLHIFRDCYVYI